MFDSISACIWADWLQTSSFSDGFERLKEHVDEFQRDHWIQCVACQKWRIISFESMLAGRDQDWNCKDLRYARSRLYSMPHC